MAHEHVAWAQLTLLAVDAHESIIRPRDIDAKWRLDQVEVVPRGQQQTLQFGGDRPLSATDSSWRKT